MNLHGARREEVGRYPNAVQALQIDRARRFRPVRADAKGEVGRLADPRTSRQPQEQVSLLGTIRLFRHELGPILRQVQVDGLGDCFGI